MCAEGDEYLVVAIDGPAGSGKSTVARHLARRLGAVFLDTGAIYRCLALIARREAVSWDDAQGLADLAARMDLSFVSEPAGEGQRVLLGREDVSDAIRTPDISGGASDVSRHAEVRCALLAMQRRFAEQGDVVAEGRDIGTVVFPAAGVKIFLTAAPSERARRRLVDLRRAGHAASLASVLAQQTQRDTADSKREVAPLKAAEDAVAIDTTSLQLEEVVERIYRLCRAARLRTYGEPDARRVTDG